MSDPTDVGLFLEVGRSASTPFSALPNSARPNVRQVPRRRPASYDLRLRGASCRTRWRSLTDEPGPTRIHTPSHALISAPRSLERTHPIQQVASARRTRLPETRRLLSEAARAGIPSTTTGANVGTARLVEYRNDQVRVDVDAAAPAVLILTDSYYRGWHVTVNGKSQHLARVDETVRGVLVPAGRSRASSSATDPRAFQTRHCYRPRRSCYWPGWCCPNCKHGWTLERTAPRYSNEYPASLARPLDLLQPVAAAGRRFRSRLSSNRCSNGNAMIIDAITMRERYTSVSKAGLPR